MPKMLPMVLVCALTFGCGGADKGPSSDAGPDVQHSQTSGADMQSAPGPGPGPAPSTPADAGRDAGRDTTGSPAPGARDGSTSPPDAGRDARASGNANDGAASFRDDFDGTQIDPSVWQVATWVEHGGQTGAERCYVEDGYLKMVLVNDSSRGILSSAIQTRQEFLYGRWEARIKPSNVPGVLNSMFTIDWDDTDNASSDSDGTKQEIDIEFLTHSFAGDRGQVHFAIHAAGRQSTDTRPDIDLPFDPSADFHVWGFEVTPERVEWFVDDTVLWTYEYAGNDIRIDSPYMLKFNVWTMENWINGPPQPDVESVYLIDWIRFIPR